MILPDSRIFLVRLSDRVDPDLGEPVGRIEHVESGLRARFSSLDEMRGFMTQVLAQESALKEEGLLTDHLDGPKKVASKASS